MPLFRKNVFLLFALLAISCNPFENISEVKKWEEALKNPRFKELPEEEMYAFLNEVYLKKFDRFQAPPAIYSHPLDYVPKVNKIFDKEYKSRYPQHNRKVSPRVYIHAPFPDTTYTWHSARLSKVKIINDWDKYMDTAQNKSIMFVSKPFFDSKENVIIIREYPTGPWCCLCEGENICFSKTDSGWTRVSCPASILYR